MQNNIPETTKKVRRCLEFARPHWKMYALVLGLSIITSLISLATPYISKIFFDDVLVNRKFDLFGLVIVAFLASFLVGKAIGIAQSFFSTRLSLQITNSVRFSVFSHLQDLGVDFFKEKNVGDLLYRFSNDIPAVYRLISLITSGGVLNAISIVGALAIALSLNWQITVFALLTVPILFIADRHFLNRQVGLRKDLIEKSAELFNFLNDSVRHYITIRIFGKEKETTNEFVEKTNDYSRTMMDEYVSTYKQSLLNELISYVPVFVVLTYGGFLVLNGESSIGTLVALQLYIPQVYGPFLTVIGFRRNILFELISVDRIFEILDTRPALEDPSDMEELGEVDGAMMAEGLAVSLGRKKVLKGVDFAAEPGKITAIAGPSGVGKTTLTYALARLYEPDRGDVLLDGTNLRKINLRSLRKSVCFVTQEPFVFSGTIEENIRFSKPNATEEEMWQAAKAANADEFVKSFPEKYATHVGIHGSKLSMGQMQRIALARAFLADTKVLLIDEGFNSVDARSEYRILRELRQLARRGKTVVMTSHRLSVLKEADEIFLLCGGRIVEKGRYKELVGKQGRFYKLYMHQLKP